MNGITSSSERTEYTIVTQQIARKKAQANCCCIYLPLAAVAVTAVAGLYFSAKALQEGNGQCPSHMPECILLFSCSIVMFAASSITGVVYRVLEERELRNAQA